MLTRYSSSYSLPSLLGGAVTVAALMISLPTATSAKTSKEIAQIATPRTVQINTPLLPGGSGVLIGKQGSTYMVLTANHVVKRPDLPYTVRTNLGKEYPARIQQLQSNQNSPDLAVVTFESSDKYPTATIGNSDQAVVGSEIYVIGYPAVKGLSGAERGLEFTQGIVTSRPHNRPQGYTLRYNAVTRAGMSGGPVFDSNGRVIGIHGQGDVEGSFQSESGGSIAVKTGFNSAIPIKTFIAIRSQSGQGAANVAVDNSPSTDKPKERLDNPKSASDFVAKGVVKSEQGDKSEAIDAYSQAINRDPNYADAYYQRGNTRYDQGDKQGALADYTKAISIDPNYANAYFQRAATRYNQDDKQGALADFDRYISLVPNDTDGYYSRGTIRRALGDAQGAFADFDQIVRLAPDDAKAYYNRGLVRAALQDQQGTLEDLNQAIKLNPKWTVAYNNRAIYRRRLGDRKGAIADFSQVISLDPKDGIAYFNRGLVRRDLGDSTGAIADLQSAADLFQQKGDKDNYYKAIGKIQDVEGTLKDTSVQPSPESTVEQQPVDENPDVQSPHPDDGW